MIIFKKSHAEQLLHLALALSLLRPHPSTYDTLSWARQSAAAGGHHHIRQHQHADDDGLQLELTHMPSAHSYPYAGRKAHVIDDYDGGNGYGDGHDWPAILQDLVHLSRFREFEARRHDMQTYLLNIHNSEPVVLSEHDPVAVATSQSNETAADVAAAAAGVVDANAEGGAMNTFGISELDLFLHSDHFTDSASLLDLNLADLRDYEELIVPPTMATTPQMALKDEVPDIFDATGTAGLAFWLQNGGGGGGGASGDALKVEDDDDDGEPPRGTATAAGTSYTSSGIDTSSFRAASNRSSTSPSLSDDDSKPDWEQFLDLSPPTSTTIVKTEPADADNATNASAAANEAAALALTVIKEEQPDGEVKIEEPDSDDSDGADSTSSGFVSTVELTQEVVQPVVLCVQRVHAIIANSGTYSLYLYSNFSTRYYLLRFVLDKRNDYFITL